MAKAKHRVDQLLVDRGLAESRTKAQALIMAGQVLAGTRRVAKSGETVPVDQELTVKSQDHPWVSRGGLKLVEGLDKFGIDPTGLVCLDIGASTGGFTDVLLSRGAAKVYAVDVGHGQLAWKLRQDERVVVLERTNARHLTAEQVSEPVDLIVCDASFIGLAKVLERNLRIMTRSATTQAASVRGPALVSNPNVGGTTKPVAQPAVGPFTDPAAQWWAGATALESDHRLSRAPARL